MIRHGVCFRHQGLLVFPTLFPEPPTEAEAEKLSHAVSLWYDFTGAIDNVYASLVGGLMVLRPFGPGRLTPGRAEFDDPDHGLCGLRRLHRPAGLAHVELFFGPATLPARRDKFIAFVEAHLRENGVEVTECRAIKCPECGTVTAEETVRSRIADGRGDVVCSRCERRIPIREGMTGGVAEIRERDPQTDAKVLALRQEIKAKLALDAVIAKAVISGVAGDRLDPKTFVIQTGDHFNISGDIIGSAVGREAELNAREAAVNAAVRVARGPSSAGITDDRAGSVRILHLSDLHFTPDTKWQDHLDPLLHDLRHEDLGCDVIHHLVISGDFVDKGNPRSFPAAREFVSALRRAARPLHRPSRPHPRQPRRRGQRRILPVEEQEGRPERRRVRREGRRVPRPRSNEVARALQTVLGPPVPPIVPAAVPPQARRTGPGLSAREHPRSVPRLQLRLGRRPDRSQAEWLAPRRGPERNHRGSRPAKAPPRRAASAYRSPSGTTPCCTLME